MLNGENPTITIFLLASRQEAPYVEEFWKHTALLRRQFRAVTCASPLYVEDMITSRALIPAVPAPSIVIGCLSPSVVAALLDQGAPRELVQRAMRRIPAVISPCDWDQAPCPFRGLMPVTTEAISTASHRDLVCVKAVGRIRVVLASLAQEG